MENSVGCFVKNSCIFQDIGKPSGIDGFRFFGYTMLRVRNLGSRRSMDRTWVCGTQDLSSILSESTNRRVVSARGGPALGGQWIGHGFAEPKI